MNSLDTNPDPSGCYTTAQVAEIFGVDRTTPMFWARRYKLPILRTGPRSWRVIWPVEAINEAHNRRMG